MTLDDTPTASDSLRDRMRRDSAGLHHALDDRLGGLSLCHADGLTDFLRINERGFSALAACTGQGADIAADLAERLRRDLAILNATPLPPAPAFPGGISALAIDYVVLGSRLGTSFLKRIWAGAADPLVRRANNYFEAPAQADAWRDFCKQTCNMPPQGDTADCVVDDIIRIFRLFCASADMLPLRTTHCLKDTDERQ